MKRRTRGCRRGCGGGILPPFVVAGAMVLAAARGEQVDALPRCRLVPLPNDEVSFVIEGDERLRWHFGGQNPRPFLYPVIGPAGVSLTRMGHPGAANHDHHRSVWFAHHDVNGADFWSDQTEASIRQKEWLVYRDGADEAIMASLLGWYPESDGREIMEQELIVSMRPLPAREMLVELQSTFRAREKEVVLGVTNFGFLAVRVAKSISTYFGGGVITSSEGETDEPAIFGEPARWMDYAGPVATSAGGGEETNGITCFDHPSNPGYPSRWHVRDDGWMGPSVCRTEALTLTPDEPLVLRYLLHVHAGEIKAQAAEALAAGFADSAPYQVSKSKQKHHQFEVFR